MYCSCHSLLHRPGGASAACWFRESCRSNLDVYPRGLREASAQLAWGGPHWPWRFDVFALLNVIDWGDVSFEYGNPQEMLDAVEAHAGEILGAGKSLLSLGGDHLVTLPLLRAHARHRGKLALIHFDAHTDTYDETGRFDHGSMF